MRNFVRQLSELKFYWLPIALFMVVSYGLYLCLSDDLISEIGDEDQLFENLTALFFLIAAFFFLRGYLIAGNAWRLFLAVVLFVGFGEEIAWGQRIFGFQTPDALSEVNVQREFTFHNIEFLNAHDFNHHLKEGWAKLWTINFLYKAGCLAYGFFLPLLVACSRPVARLADRMRLPIPPLSLGVWFIANWVVFKATSVFLLPIGKGEQYYDTIGEISECGSALVFLVISAYFLDVTRRASSGVRSIRATHAALPSA